MQPPSARSSVFAVTGDNVSAAAGRVSFALDLHGSCCTIDAARASALAALHAAARAYAVPYRLATAVSLKLQPGSPLFLAPAGMLSVVSRCDTLDRAGGDRGEWRADSNNRRV